MSINHFFITGGWLFHFFDEFTVNIFDLFDILDISNRHFNPRMDPLLHKLADSTKVFVEFAFEKSHPAVRCIDMMETVVKAGAGDGRELSMLEKMIIKNPVRRVRRGESSI